MKRRQYLRRAAGLGAGLSVVSGTAAASHPEQQPEHVTISFDKALCEQYQPYLVTRNLDIQPQALWSWIATSPEYQYDWYVYWAEYVAQQGVSDYDSHAGDHEPLYIGVDKDTGEVQVVLYSGYHWLKATAQRSALSFEGQHALFHVIKPWHHYRLTDEVGVEVDLGNLTQAFESWRDNGLEDPLLPGSVHNPERMLAEEDWWANDIDGRANAILVRTLNRVGFHDASEADI